MEFPRMDKTKFEIIDLHEQKNDYDYWMSKSPEERFQAIAIMRKINYGDRATERLQRVLEVVESE